MISRINQRVLVGKQSSRLPLPLQRRLRTQVSLRELFMLAGCWPAFQADCVVLRARPDSSYLHKVRQSDKQRHEELAKRERHVAQRVSRPTPPGSDEFGQGLPNQTART